MKLLKNLLFATIATVSACGFCGFSLANPIVGTIGFNVNGSITQSAGSLDLAFDVSNVVTNNSASGDWVPFNTGIQVANLIQFPAFNGVGSAFSFSNATFGNFTATITFDSGQTGSTSFPSRSIVAFGTFVPGTTLNAQGFTTPVEGEFVMLLQSSGGSRSAAIVFGTSAVPEPTSLALLGSGFALASCGWRLRKNRVGKRSPNQESV